MTTERITENGFIRIEETSSTEYSSKISSEDSDMSPVPFSMPTHMPASISAGQAYYWTHTWQADEEETRKALQRGEGQTFDSGQEAIRWLLSDDE